MRDGESVMSMILAPERSVEGKMKGGELSLDQSAIAEFVTTTQCRRRIMSEYLDGPEHAVACNELGAAALCDRCGDGLDELRSSERQYAAEWERVKGVLDDVVGHCSLCWAQSDEEGFWCTHRLAECRQGWPGQSVGELDGLRRRSLSAGTVKTVTRLGRQRGECMSMAGHCGSGVIGDGASAAAGSGHA